MNSSLLRESTAPRIALSAVNPQPACHSPATAGRRLVHLRLSFVFLFRAFWAFLPPARPVAGKLDRPVIRARDNKKRRYFRFYDLLKIKVDTIFTSENSAWLRQQTFPGRKCRKVAIPPLCPRRCRRNWILRPGLSVCSQMQTDWSENWQAKAVDCRILMS